MNVLYVRTETQKAIFEGELQGQLSDGYWENANTDRRLWDCIVVVAKKGEKLGCNFIPRYRKNFNQKDLIEVVGDRMIGYAQKVKKNYNEDDLIADLIELTEMVFGDRDLRHAPLHMY